MDTNRHKHCRASVSDADLFEMAFHRMEPAGAERHGRAGPEAEPSGAGESNALQMPDAARSKRSSRSFFESGKEENIGGVQRSLRKLKLARRPLSLAATPLCLGNPFPSIRAFVISLPAGRHESIQLTYFKTGIGCILHACRSRTRRRLPVHGDLRTVMFLRYEQHRRRCDALQNGVTGDRGRASRARIFHAPGSAQALGNFSKDFQKRRIRFADHGSSVEVCRCESFSRTSSRIGRSRPPSPKSSSICLIP